MEGRVAVVTGAGAGIGEATARRLLQAGARVALLDIDEADLDRWFANVDFQVPEDVCEAVHRWAEHYGLSRVDDLSPIDSQFWMDKSTEYRDHAERNMSDDAAA